MVGSASVYALTRHIRCLGPGSPLRTTIERLWPPSASRRTPETHFLEAAAALMERVTPKRACLLAEARALRDWGSSLAET